MKTTITLLLLTNLAIAQYDTYTPQKHVSTYVPMNFDAIQQSGATMQARHDRKEMENELKVSQCKQQIVSYYNSLTSYKTIADGFHKAYVLSTDNTLCETRQVYCENNRITQYLLPNGIQRSIANTFPIVNAKTMVELIIPDHPNSLLTVYFLE